MLLKCFIQNGSKFRKFTGFHRTEEGQYSFQSQREIMPKNVQITTQLHSFHMLANYCSQSLKLGFNKQYLNWELPHVQTGFRKGRGTRDQVANIHWIIKKAREFQKKNLFLLYWLRQSLWLCASQETVENSERDGNTRSQVRKQRLELDMEQQNGFQLRK